MLNSDEFNKMITKYCSDRYLKNLDFWEVYIPSCTYDIEEYVTYRIEAQHKKYLKVEKHQIKIDDDKNIHQFAIVELTSDSVVRMIQESGWYELTESDIEEIKLGLDNSYCEMRYYVVEYYFHSEYDCDDYDHDEALWVDGVWVNDNWINEHRGKWNIFTDKREAINWIYENYLEDEWVVEEELS